MTATDPLEPAASTVKPVGLTEIAGAGGAASWVTVNVIPVPLSGVTTIVAVRELPDVFGWALQPTVPAPAPVAPEVTESQDWVLGVPVHCKSVSVVLTVMVPVPPDDPGAALCGLMLNVPPPCVTATVVAVPPVGVMVTLVVRLVPEGLPLAES